MTTKTAYRWKNSRVERSSEGGKGRRPVVFPSKQALKRFRGPIYVRFRDHNFSRVPSMLRRDNGNAEALHPLCASSS